MRRRVGLWAVALASVVVIVTAVVAGVFASRLSGDPQAAPSPLIGAPSPVLSLPLLEGPGEITVPVPEAQVTIVNFFASWCLECRVEHADLLAVAHAFSDAGVRLVQVAYQDRTSDAIAFLNEMGVSPLVRYVADPRSRAAISFGVFGVPETFLIGPDGRVAERITGPSDALGLGEGIDRILGGARRG